MALSAALAADDLEARLRRECDGAWICDTAAAEAYTVDAARPRLAVAPRSADDVGRIVTIAEELGAAIIPAGNGTHLHIGQAPRQYDLALTTTAMATVRQHDAADMTVTVDAGATLDTLGAALAGADQWLPIDAPHPARVTVGGLIAADRNGGLRLSHGKVRDYLIGVRVVIGGGQLVRGGGQVVKNVAGYDLPKFLIGSYGTLGVIVEATFKVRPRPAADATLVAPVASTDAAAAQAAAILSGPFAPFAVDLLDSGTSAAVGLPARVHIVVRVGGEHEEVRDQQERLVALAPGASEIDATTIAALRDFQLDGPGTVACRVSALPRDVGLLLRRIGDEAAAFGVTPCVQAHAGNGILHVRSGGEPAGLVAFVRWLRFLSEQRGGFTVVEQAPAHLKAELDVWGRAAGPLTVMRGIKHALDPHAMFSPGRFVGGI